MKETIVKFLRKKDLVFIKELGHGAYGRTVILHDETIDEDFVCKKYSPINKDEEKELFKNFIEEIKLLHLLYHRNVVRVFNYYLYPESYTGYILMELVEGPDVEDYLAKYPENVNEIFVQIIEGFTHLEYHNILHRDIRPQNILVSDDGMLKIIDFGFGKKVDTQSDFGKSISLNWWCDPPSEFTDDIYNYTTEVYFVGKLLENIITTNSIEQFKYKNLLKRMCASDPLERVKSFSLIKNEILSEKFSDMDFTEQEIYSYREFSKALCSIIAIVEHDTKYINDIDEVQHFLEESYKEVMLEEYVSSNSSIIGCFLNGSYKFYTTREVEVSTIKAFIELLRSCSREKKNIILSNIQTRLGSIERDSMKKDSDEANFDDVPF